MSTLTAREQQLIALGLQCYDTQPKIDYTKLAELSGLKNGSTASVMYGNAKRKLLGIAPKVGGPGTPSKGGDDITCDGDGADPLDPDTPTTTPKKKSTPRKRKTATPKAGGEGAGENGEDGATETTPKPKRVRKTPVKKAAKSAVVVKEDGSETEPVIGSGDDIIKDESAEASEVKAEPEAEETYEFLVVKTEAPGEI